MIFSCFKSKKYRYEKNHKNLAIILVASVTKIDQKISFLGNSYFPIQFFFLKKKTKWMIKWRKLPRFQQGNFRLNLTDTNWDLSDLNSIFTVIMMFTVVTAKNYIKIHISNLIGDMNLPIEISLDPNWRYILYHFQIFKKI